MSTLSAPLASSGSVPPAPGHETPDAQGTDQSGATDPTGPTGAGIPAGPAIVDRDARNLAVVAHLSSLVAFTGIPSFLGPLAIWLLQRERDPFVEEHAREAMNFNLSVLVYLIALTAFTIVTFGIGLIVLVPVLLVGAPAWLIATTIAAVKAGNGERFRYPLSIRFVR